MTVRRTGSGWVDDARLCIGPGCTMPAPVEPWQVEWPERVAYLKAQAEIVMNVRRRATVIAGPNELRRRASELDEQIKEARKRPIAAWLCESHHRQLRTDTTLGLAWGGARHDSTDVETIERTIAFLAEHPLWPKNSSERGLPSKRTVRRLAPA
jgi:hypothetical protein